MHLKRLSLLIFLLFLSFVISVNLYSLGMQCTVNGDWSVTVDGTSLIGGPGTTVIGTYESASDQATVAVWSITKPEFTYRLDVSKSDSQWHNDFTLSVRRTNDGSGSGSISDGTDYQVITDSDESFFEGEDSRTGVNLQYKLEGVSITIPADIYSTTVTYTVTGW